MKDEQVPVRKIIKKKGHGGGHHGGAWKVAYADFVTTMMALFIVLWITGQGASTREAIARYFRDPGVLKSGGKNSLLAGTTGILDGEGDQRERASKRAEAPDDGVDQEEARLKAAAEDIKGLLERAGLFGYPLRDQIKIELTAEGLRIELIEQETSPFFEVGSATPLDSTRAILQNLAIALEKLPNQITVEGHTDSRQYAIRNYSNWELSSDRANSARRILETSRLPAARIERVVGYADRLLLVPGQPLNPSNRRIAILVSRMARQQAAAQPVSR